MRRINFRVVAYSFKVIFLMGLLAMAVTAGYGQVKPSSSIAGTVTDPQAALVAGATVVVKNNATGEERTVTTTDNGTYSVPALTTGTYTVTITATNFKQAVVTGVKVDVGAPSTINVALEVGESSEQVTIVGGGEVLQTQTATVGTTVTGRQITETPFTSRDALDLVMLLPGTQSPGPTRTSTINGLPKASINITQDGVNTQAQDSKSAFGGGFFTYIRPRIDAIDEVTVSTANPGSEASSGGAIQIQFVTRGGSNDINGSLYWYHRNPRFAANYYYRNRDLQPLPGEAKVRPDRILLNQYGGRVGGPIRIPGLYDGRDRTFFFVNYEEYRIPEQFFRQRTILSPDAQAGIFRYTGAPAAGVNLFTVAAGAGQTSTLDPTIGPLLAAIRASTTQGSVTPLADPNLQRFSFTATGGQVRKFATVRFDHKITEKHSLENVWNYNIFDSTVDFLNSVDPIYPGLAIGSGSQISLRFSNVTALKSYLTSNVVNEARFGLTGGTVLFFPEIEPNQFTPTGAFQLTVTAAGMNNPGGANQNFRRNTPVKQFSDVLTWTRGAHTFNFGMNINQYNYWNSGKPTVVPSATMSFVSTDPANGMFNTTNFPGASSADLDRARGIYAVLTGRLTATNANAFLGEDNGQYTFQGALIDRFRQREYGFYVQDAWRWRPNLTINWGLRWDIAPSHTTKNDLFTRTTYEGLWGLSGVGNLFTPGASGGVSTQFNPIQPGDKAFNTDWNNIAPSVGIVWTPDWKSGLLGGLFGTGGQTVLRGGWSRAFVREGTEFYRLHGTQNPGGTLPLSRSTTIGNLAPGSLFRDPASRTFPAFATTPTFPIVGTLAHSPAAFNPEIQLGFVDSFSFGFQRELNKDTVFEARYVGNRGKDLWRTWNLNELNTVENGLAAEFRLAQANLVANIGAGRGQNFRYFGPGTGTSPLPIFAGFIAACTTPTSLACYTSGNFGPGTGLVGTSATTFTNLLSPANPNPIGVAGQFRTNFRVNGLTAGFPANIFVVNPQVTSAFTIDNGAESSYDALVIELRRRLSGGLLIQGNYTFSKSLTNLYGSSTVNNVNFATLRDPNLNKTRSPYDLTHAFKINYIYEFPFGRGKTWLSGANGLVERLLGGWETHGAIRMQSGSAINFGNIQLVGMTTKEFAESLEIRKDPNRITFFLPQDIIDNTIRAFSTSPTGYSGTAPTGRFLAPPGFGNCASRFMGDCGFSNLVIHGPKFFRADLSIVKKIKMTERTNVELRGEFLNAFNNINFWVGRGSTTENGVITPSSAATFGQTNAAFQDVSTTNDPGGRLVQFVLRINF
jgi:hypothetical protein